MLPKLIQIGSFYLPSYGVLVATAFLTALWLAGKLGRMWGISRDAIMNLGVYCALAGIVGAKLFMIAVDPYYRSDPAQIFTFATLQSAGIWYGGLITALLFSYFYMRSERLPFLQTSDAFAPGLAIGHGIGRLGCFASGCCYGKPTSLPWAVTYTNPDANGAPLNIPLHPTQIYEFIIESIICVFLYRQALRPHKDGQILALYLVLSGLARFAVEFLRHHDQANPLGGPFTLEQWISLAVVAMGAYMITRPAPTPVAPVLKRARP